MIKSNELINQAVEVLIANGMEKTGGRFAFTGYQDLKINEIEMLEFLFQFEEAMEKFVELAEQKKREPVFLVIDKLMYHLNKTHNFGFLNRKKVEVLDTISDISQIEMKPRYVVFMDILKALKPDIETLFVEAYNKTQPYLNPLRVEQVLCYLREYLEYEGINTKYSDFILAAPHIITGDCIPYFCRSHYGYYVVDTLFGGYGGSLFLCSWPGEKTQWNYISSKCADRCHGRKYGAEAQIAKLRELNAIAGIEGLNWEIVYANQNDVYFNVLKEGKIKMGDYHHFDQDIPKGKIMLHRKLYKDVIASYKSSRRSA